MKTFIVAAAFAGFVAAQQMDVAAVAAAPAPAMTEAPVGASNQGTVQYDPAAKADAISAAARPTAAETAKIKRHGGDCAPEPKGSAPDTIPDTDKAFQANPFFHGVANIYPPVIPSGHSYYVEKFRDLNASTQQNSYLTYYQIDRYSVPDCANKCDQVELCTAFNIYVERNPSIDAGPACPNPKSVSRYKCALYGSSISRETATNDGQYRANFHVVITGSNGYDRSNWAPAPLIDGFAKAENLSGQTITLAKKSFYLGAEFFSGPYDPHLCSWYATAQTLANKLDAKAKGYKSYQPANLFNAYCVYKNKKAQGTYCSIFNTNPGGAEVYGNPGTTYQGDSYTVGTSYTYALSPQDSGYV
jgi:hypothetical protein